MKAGIFLTIAVFLVLCLFDEVKKAGKLGEIQTNWVHLVLAAIFFIGAVCWFADAIEEIKK